jgi:hypothetical protein
VNTNLRTEEGKRSSGKQMAIAKSRSMKYNLFSCGGIKKPSSIAKEENGV